MGLQWRSLLCHAVARVARAPEAVTDQYLGPSGSVQPLSVAGGKRAASPKGLEKCDQGFARCHVTSPHLRYGCALNGALAAITLVACGGSTDAGGPAPTIAYSGPAVFTKRVYGSYKPDSVSSGSAFTVSPGLPPGLELDPRTGTIAGVPTAASPSQEYTVSASNLQGTATTKVALEVSNGVLFYPSPAILVLGVAMSPLVPNATTYLSAYSVDPALPQGLSLDPHTGVISGTPTEPSSPSYYKVVSTDNTFHREYGLTLGVTDLSASPGLSSAAPFNCVHSGGFIGTFVADSADKSYGVIAIAFTPDGNANTRVDDLTGEEIYEGEDDSQGLQALSPSMDGTFQIRFANGNSLRGGFSGPDFISGTYQVGGVVKSFSAARLGGSAKAQYRYTGGFDDNQSTDQEIDFATVDITGSAVSGEQYEISDSGSDYLLINWQLPFESTIVDGMFTASLGWDTFTTPYTAGQSGLFIGDYLAGIRTVGCQLN